MSVSTWLEALQNPLNLGLLVIASYLFYKNYIEGAPPAPTPSHPTVIELQDFTPKELAKFNGTNGTNIYLSIKGVVYDVSSKPGFYGPGSSYENFAGRDASRGMAKHSFDAEMLTPLDQPIDNLEDLNQEEIDSLNEWASFFAAKYPVVGKLVQSK